MFCYSKQSIVHTFMNNIKTKSPLYHLINLFPYKLFRNKQKPPLPHVDDFFLFIIYIIRLLKGTH